MKKDEPEFVRARTIAKRLDCGLSTVWRMAEQGRIPPPVLKMGARITLWNWQDVLAAIEAGNE